MFRNLFAAFAAACFFYACPAQDLHYINYSVNEGLPSSQVHDIYQDVQGRLWFTTDQGLSCYDGYAFKNYTTVDGLTDDVTFKFHPTPDGKVWCTTFNRSVFYFVGKDPVFTPYKYNDVFKNIPEHFISNNLAITEDGSLFMGFANAKGYIHVGNTGRIQANTVESTHNPATKCLFIWKNNNSFFFNKDSAVALVSGSWNKVILSSVSVGRTNLSRSCYFPLSGSTVFTGFDNVEILSAQGKTLVISSAFQPISLGKFTDSSFWVGFRYGGLSVYDLNGKCLFSTLKGKSVTRLLVDHEGGYWCSTLHDGVFHARNIQVFYHTLGNNEKDWINMLCKDKNNKLWISYYHGNVDCMNHGKIKNVHLGSTGFPSQLRRNDATGEMILFGDYKIIFPDRNLKTYEVNLDTPLGVYVLSDDSIVMCGYGGVYRWNKNHRKWKFLDKKANDITFYKGKWFIAGNDGLYSIEKDTSLKKEAGTTRVVDIEKWNGRLLLASKASGLIIWDGKSSFTIGTAQGLCSNTVQGIYPENDSVIWAYTNSGADRIVVRNGKVLGIKNISTNDGLVSNEVTAVEVVNDTVWIGTRQGLCFFPSHILHEPGKTAANNFLSISAVRINDKAKHYNRSSLESAYRENRIEFLFGAISFSESRKPFYRYKLAGLETRWKYTNERSALYASLPAGKYTFKVQAKTTGAGWGETVELSLNIFPPFWKTWWFIVAVTIVLITLIYLFFRFRILSYNRDISRELLRQLLKRLKRKTNHVVFREQGKDIRIPTDAICYVKADGNYIEIHTDTKKYVVRHKIGEFMEIVPDPLEYLRVSRSYIVRLDKVQEKSKKDLTVKGEKIAVGETYLDQLQKIKF